MKRSMNYNGTLTLKNNKSDLRQLMQAISCFIEEIDHATTLIADGASEIIKLRRHRKQLEKALNTYLKTFSSLSESKKVEVELFFFKSARKLNKILPQTRVELKANANHFIFWLVNREMTQFVSLIDRTQKTMSAAIYKDNTLEIQSNPILYKKMEEAWGDWDNE